MRSDSGLRSRSHHIWGTCFIGYLPIGGTSSLNRVTPSMSPNTINIPILIFRFKDQGGAETESLTRMGFTTLMTTMFGKALC